MVDFTSMVTKILTDLRRSNLVEDGKQAVQDAITEAAKNRFWFNEYRTTFNTSAGLFEYGDLGFVEIDELWDAYGGQRYTLEKLNAEDFNRLLEGNQQSGIPTEFALYGGMIRMNPIPIGTRPIWVEGYGKLTPLESDTDTNSWLDEGELYIRALAKRNILRDIVRDYGEAAALESIAEGYKQDLLETTALKIGTNTLRATRF